MNCYLLCGFAHESNIWMGVCVGVEGKLPREWVNFEGIVDFGLGVRLKLGSAKGKAQVRV